MKRVGGCKPKLILLLLQEAFVGYVSNHAAVQQSQLRAVPPLGWFQATVQGYGTAARKPQAGPKRTPLKIQVGGGCGVNHNINFDEHWPLAGNHRNVLT